MASMMKKAMIYLGLGPDEEYEQYDDYAAPAPAPVRDHGPGAGPPRNDVAPETARPTSNRQRLEERPLVHPQNRPDGPVHPHVPTGTVRPISNESDPPRPASGEGARPDPVQPRAPSVSSAVRTIGPAAARPHAVSPGSFNDAQEIGDRFKSGQPVIVNLQACDRDLRRRLVDFSSGLCYAIAGKMERVADQVYLLTPADVEVPPEETQRHLD